MLTPTSAAGSVTAGTIVGEGSLLRGATTARYGNPHHALTLAGATLVFYAVQALPSRAEQRWGFQRAKPEGVQGRELARARVQDDGGYAAVLPAGIQGSVLVAIDVERFSYAPETGRRAFGLLGAASPRWEEAQGGRRAVLDIDLPHSSYCDILGLLGLWLVAGRVTGCVARRVSCRVPCRPAAPAARSGGPRRAKPR